MPVRPFAVALAFLLAGAAQAQELLPPRRIGEFRFVKRDDYDNPELGYMARYRHADSLDADVFVYPGPDLATRCNESCAREALKAERDEFMKAFDIMMERGRYQRIQVLGESPLTPAAGAPWKMGHRLHLIVRAEDKDHHSDFWIVYLPGKRLKVRATFDHTPAREAQLDRFLDQVVAEFTGPGEKVAERPRDRPLPGAFNLDSLWAFVPGRWDWENAEDLCNASPMTVSIAADRKSVIFVTPPDSAGGKPDTTTYKVTQAGDQVLTWAPFAIRMEIEGEERRTEDGKPVVWDLAFGTRDRFYWHRTDWPKGNTTRGNVRCDR